MTDNGTAEPRGSEHHFRHMSPPPYFKGKAASELHPSDYHADMAGHKLLHALSDDPSVRRNALDAANVYATLSLRDAVLEATATLKNTWQRHIAVMVDSTEATRDLIKAVEEANTLRQRGRRAA